MNQQDMPMDPIKIGLKEVRPQTGSAASAEIDRKLMAMAKRLDSNSSDLDGVIKTTSIDTQKGDRPQTSHNNKNIRILKPATRQNHKNNISTKWGISEHFQANEYQ